MSQQKNELSSARSDLSLSLTCSQISSVSGNKMSNPSSYRRPSSDRSVSRSRPSSSGGVKTKKGSVGGRDVSANVNATTKLNTSNNSQSFKEASRGRDKKLPNAQDDFLAFFESSKIQPKILRPKSKQRSSKPSPLRTQHLSEPHEAGSNVFDTPLSGSSFSHSIFEPISTRTSTTLDDYDSLTDITQQNGIQDGGSLENNENNLHISLTAENTLPGSFSDEINNKPLKRSSFSPSGSVTENTLNLNEDLNSINPTSVNPSINGLLANNMTLQGLSMSSSKVPLQNSYQNIKRKIPVNQMSSGFSNYNTANALRLRNQAASKIQNWYRRLVVHKFLTNKRQEVMRSSIQNEVPLRLTDEGRKKVQAEKAQKARQKAINELQKKREQKRFDVEQIAQEEITLLKNSGKLTKSSNVTRKQFNGARPKESYTRSQYEEVTKPTPTSTTDRKIDDIFHNNKPRAKVTNKEQVDDNRISNLEVGLVSSFHSNNSTEDTAVSLLSNQSGTKTTIDDLMNSLKKLESDDSRINKSSNNATRTSDFSWLDDLEKHHSDTEKNDELTVDKPLHQSNPNKDNRKKSSQLTDEKIRSIMSFLDEVDMTDRLDSIDQEIDKKDDLGSHYMASTEEISQLEQVSAKASEVTNTMLSQRLDLEEKKRTVSMLQKALNQQRELTVRHARETEKEMSKRLNIQKEEHEETVKRHLSFIDQLIDDKKSLNEKCENLLKELKTLEQKYGVKIKQMQDNFETEIKKIKDVQIAAEKLRREKWIDEKTKKIKEMTVKGLEPEIQRLIAKHKSEIQRLKSIHEAELLASDERAGGRYIKMTEELRDQLATEKEAACSRERELARQTYEKQLVQEEEAYQQQRRRLHAEVQSEKDRLASSAIRQRAELDRLQRNIEDNQATATATLRNEYEKAREEQENRHQNEISKLKETLSLEKEAWEENFKKRQDTWLAAKERELRETVKRDRDKEIELVISRLETDSQSTRDETERLADARVKRIRDKYEAEMSELERQERIVTEKYNKTKAQLAEVEGENERRAVALRQKDKDIDELKKILDRRNQERDVVSDVIRQEFADRIVATEEENRRVKNDIAELKSRHLIEIERVQTEVEVVQKAKQEEMEEVHKRVKQAIVKKEEATSQLKEQLQAAQKRADHLEGLLDQQRKQLLARK